MARGAGTSGRSWWVGGAGDVQVGRTLHQERRWGAGEIERASKRNGYGWGGDRKEGVKNDPETGKIVGAEGID